MAKSLASLLVSDTRTGPAKLPAAPADWPGLMEVGVGGRFTRLVPMARYFIAMVIESDIVSIRAEVADGTYARVDLPRGDILGLAQMLFEAQENPCKQRCAECGEDESDGSGHGEVPP